MVQPCEVEGPTMAQREQTYYSYSRMENFKNWANLGHVGFQKIKLSYIVAAKRNTFTIPFYDQGIYCLFTFILNATLNSIVSLCK